MAEKSRNSRSASDEEGTDLLFDPGSQVELEPEEVCCVTGQPVESTFCRFPDYRRGTLMAMSKKGMLEHLRAGTTIEKFKEVLAKRHGREVLDELYSSY